jgi:hypothetical protein
MSSMYIDVPGDSISTDVFQLADAKEIAHAVVQGSYTELIDSRRTDLGEEIVIFDTKIELGQRRVHDIKSIERIAVVCDSDATKVPEIMALRSDFPLVPHLNIRTNPYPRSLCLFEEPPEEVRLHWSAPLVVERIRQWLALTAKGRLHAQDQPLELLLPSSLHQLIVPHDLFTAVGGNDLLTVQQPIDSGNGRKTFIATRPEKLKPGQVPYAVTPVVGKPQPHGIIAKIPRTLAELHKLLQNAEINLIGELRTRLRDWKSDVPKVVDARLILIVWLPKQREVDGADEAAETRAFMIDAPIRDIGTDIGIWEAVDSSIGIGNLLVADETKNGQDVPVTLLNPHYSFSRNLAAVMSGRVQMELRIVLVGAGALGSQVFMNLVRMGYGQWTLIDDDLLLPHNLARHALVGSLVGYPKAQALAAMANHMLDGEPIVNGITANIMTTTAIPEIMSALEHAQVIVDASTSIPAARYLTHNIDSPARRISVFMNPTATDLVVLAEDTKREIPLDMLEMQYYRNLLYEPALEDHLRQSGERVRYASSCRDISATIPQDLIALHAAICSRSLRKIVGNDEAVIAVWHSEDDELNVKRYHYLVSPVLRHKVGEWTVCTDQWCISKLSAARANKLPNETGGVLIGSYDMQRKIVYIVDTILSPPDSHEWPTVYIRGYSGLKQGLERVTRITDDRLDYVGEWHSHPAGIGCVPSQDDQQAFIWLTQVMEIDGHPPLMLIAGDNQQYAVYLGQM